MSLDPFKELLLTFISPELAYPTPDTSAIEPSEVTIAVTVISFFVKVPVLSEQITFTHPEKNGKSLKHIKESYMSQIPSFLFIPRVSTVGSLFTMAFRLAIRITPNANVTVTTIGSPSGIAATAKLQDPIRQIRASVSKIQPVL